MPTFFDWREVAKQYEDLPGLTPSDLTPQLQPPTQPIQYDFGIDDINKSLTIIPKQRTQNIPESQSINNQSLPPTKNEKYQSPISKIGNDLWSFITGDNKNKLINETKLNFSDEGVKSRWDNVTPETKNIISQVFSKTGINPIITSTYRDPQRNASVGGVPNSKHLSGNAIDISIREFNPEQKSIILSEVNSIPGMKGFVHNGDHIHIQNNNKTSALNNFVKVKSSPSTSQNFLNTLLNSVTLNTPSSQKSISTQQIQNPSPQTQPSVQQPPTQPQITFKQPDESVQSFLNQMGDINKKQEEAKRLKQLEAELADQGITSALTRVEQGPSIGQKAMEKVGDVLDKFPAFKSIVDESLYQGGPQGVDLTKPKSIWDTSFIPPAIADLLITGSLAGNRGRFGEAPTIQNETLRGITNSVSDFVSGSANLKNAAIATGTAIFPPAAPYVAGGFSALGAKGAYDSGIQAYDAYKRGDTTGTAEGITNTFLNGLMAALPTKYAAKGIAKDIAPITNRYLDKIVMNKGQGEYLGSGLGGLQSMFEKEKVPLTPGEQYVQEMVAKREVARGGGEVGGVTQKTAEFYKDVKTKLVDMYAPIEDVLIKAQKEGNFEVLPKYDVSHQIDRALRAPTLAGQFVKDFGIDQVLRDVPNLAVFDQYLIAKHAKNLEVKGIKTGRDLIKDSALVEEMAPTYEPYAQKVNEFSNAILDKSVDYGLVSKDLATKLKQEYPDYVPMQRIFGELEKSDPSFQGGKGVASLSKQSVVQKIKGSEREIESPMHSLMDKAVQLFTQGEKNKAASMIAGYKDLPNNPFGLSPLRTAENVQKRTSLYEEASELKPIQRNVEKLVKTSEKQVKQLQSEIQKLEQSGLKTFFKSEMKETPTPLVSKIKIKETPTEVQFGKGDLRDEVVGGKLGETKIIGEKFATTTNKGPQSTKNFIEALITEPNINIAKIKNQIATKENKLGPILDDLAQWKEDFNGIQTQRKSLIDEGRLLSDAKSKGKDIISFFNNGVKEVWEANPEIAAAAKNLNVQQIGLLGKILSGPARIKKLGTTGIYLPFSVSNFLRDQTFATLTSKHPFKTSIANPILFVRSLFEATKKGKLYDEMVRAGGGGTSFDITRNQITPTIENFRRKSFLERITKTVSHPLKTADSVLRAAENVVGITEQATRLQQFEGTKQALLKQGRTLEDANILAAQAARKNTTDFNRRGEWGSVMNNALLYLNANIQGSRTFVRAFKERPIQTGAKLATVLYMPQAVMTAWNLNDETRKQVYQDIDEREKENNLIIIPPNPTKDEHGRWNVYKIPLPPGVNKLATPIRRMVEQANDVGKLEFKDVANSLLGAVSPIEIDSPHATMSSLLPQALRPAFETSINKDTYFNRDIVPQKLQKLSPELQYKDDTSGLARKMGEALGVSPLKIEHLVRGYFGGLGSQGLAVADTVAAQAGVIPKDQIGGEGLSEGFTKRFTTARGGNINNKEFDEVQKYSQARDDKKFLQKKEANEFITMIDGYTKEQKIGHLKELKQRNKEVFDIVYDEMKDQKLGLTPIEKQIKGLDQKTRAKYIYDKIQGMSNDESVKYLSRLKEVKLLNKDVFEYVKKYKEKNVNNNS